MANSSKRPKRKCWVCSALRRVSTGWLPAKLGTQEAHLPRLTSKQQELMGTEVVLINHRRDDEGVSDED